MLVSETQPIYETRRLYKPCVYITDIDEDNTIFLCSLLDKIFIIAMSLTKKVKRAEKYKSAKVKI